MVAQIFAILLYFATSGLQSYLAAVVSITTMLQMISCDLIEALSECQTLIRHFKTEKYYCLQHLIC